MTSDAVFINEVGPRDGLQSQKVLVSTEDKLALIQALVDAGLRSIEAASFVSPKAVPQMADADALFARLPDRDRVAYSALVPNRRGLDRALAAGVPEIAVVLSATETMNLRNINLSLAQTEAVCVETVQAALAAGVRAKAYVAVAFTCPFEGAVDPAVVRRLSRLMREAGAEEIVIADTIGAAHPREVGALMKALAADLGAEQLSAHFHDTRGFALANIWACVEAGVRRFDSSLGGLGGCPFAPGAAGNVATEDVVLMLEQCGLRTGIDIPALRRAIALAERLVGHPLGGRTARWLQSEDARAQQREAATNTVAAAPAPVGA
jgi:hydroxymethylglutaryl-CoA lyase